MILVTRLFHHISEVVFVFERRNEVLRYKKNVEGRSSVNPPFGILAIFGHFLEIADFRANLKL